jgi:hypothetical protein
MRRRRFGRWRRQADDACCIHPASQSFDLSIGAAGGRIAESDQREHAERGLDRSPLLYDKHEGVSAEEWPDRALGFDLREKGFEACRLEVADGEGFPLWLDAGDGPIGWHGRANNTGTPALTRGRRLRGASASVVAASSSLVAAWRRFSERISTRRPIRELA